MMKPIVYFYFTFLLLFTACQHKEEVIIVEEKTPSYFPQLVNWSVMNKNGWQNMSFPNWFFPEMIDSLQIERIEIDFTNFKFTDTIITVSDTLPYQKVGIDFKKNGNVREVVVKEMIAGIEIAEFTFNYKADLDTFGYSPPTVSSTTKYRKKNMFSLLNTVKEFQHYQRLVLVASDSNTLDYLDKSSIEEVLHHFILDTNNWNVSFLDKRYAPEGKNIFYYGTPQDYIASFSLMNLVEKSMQEERKYYDFRTLKSQYFYTNEFVTKRNFNYDSIGFCIGMSDSLTTLSNEFLHLEKGVVTYKGNFPQSLHFYNEEDTLMEHPTKRIKFTYKQRN